LSALYIGLALGVLAAIGVFTTVWSLTPAPPSNADVVEGRLRLYESGAPMSITEIDLQQPFGERVVRPVIKRIGRFLESTIPEKARMQIHANLQLAGRPGNLSASDFMAVRYVLTGVFCSLGIVI
jgi:tight adherence protein C